jgi:hypothetical protein
MHHVATSIVATSTRLLSVTIEDAKDDRMPKLQHQTGQVVPLEDSLIKSQVLVHFRTTFFFGIFYVLNQLKIYCRLLR